VAGDHRREMRPAVVAAVDVRDVHRPPLVAPAGATAPPWTRGRGVVRR
jgi:hypothetical protein